MTCFLTLNDTTAAVPAVGNAVKLGAAVGMIVGTKLAWQVNLRDNSGIGTSRKVGKGVVETLGGGLSHSGAYVSSSSIISSSSLGSWSSSHILGKTACPITPAQLGTLSTSKFMRSSSWRQSTEKASILSCSCSGTVARHTFDAYVRNTPCLAGSQVVVFSKNSKSPPPLAEMRGGSGAVLMCSLEKVLLIPGLARGSITTDEFDI
mmetsp:Transcript_44849/g.78286  ORF Transcript_44849/g.78286 Transcript_44849/m.78286 type:complete len:206 (+) Transcript_44849:899-1516(+)